MMYLEKQTNKQTNYSLLSPFLTHPLLPNLTSVLFLSEEIETKIRKNRQAKIREESLCKHSIV